MGFFKKLLGKEKEKPATVVATMPGGRILAVFVPTRDFFSGETQSQYLPGMKYSLREGNAKLTALLPQWEKQGLIHIL